MKYALVLLTLFVSFVFAQDGGASPDYPEWLMQKQRYDLAADAFLEQLYVEKDPQERDRIRLSIGVCTSLKGDLRELQIWNQNEASETTQGRIDRGLHLSISEMQQHVFLPSLVRLKNLLDHEKQDALFLQLGRAYACTQQAESARSAWLSVDKGSLQYSQAERWLRLLESTPVPKKKSTLLAGSLALVPGAGYLYAGHQQTAFSALLMLSTLGWASARCWELDNPGLGALSSFITFGWYAGSIHGSIQAAARYNTTQLNRYQQHFN